MNQKTFQIELTEGLASLSFASNRFLLHIQPVRILGSHEPSSITEAHLFAMFCPFCRDCLAQGLEGRYDYLDGILISESCLHIRQTYSSWKEHVPVDFAYSLPMPAGLQSRLAAPFLKKELERFKKAIDQWTGKEIRKADLFKGTEIVNTNRRLMKEVYELRKSDTPPITGLESMYMVMGNQLGDKREQNMLKQNDIPALYLEFDVTAPIGPLRVRVDVFLETLAGEDMF